MNKKKLDALTSLRFIAAAMIVLHHSKGNFGLSQTAFSGFSLDHGVSFFFVLSGFILAYVYPRLNGPGDAGRFLLARFARIWPAHLFTFAAVFLLFSAPERNWIYVQPGQTPFVALANISMVHAWIPLSQYYFSFNGVSWSISTEFFFYLAFPFIIYRWNETWGRKLIAAGVLLSGIIFLSNSAKLPGFSMEYYGISSHALVFISPFGRLFEFIMGMTTALFWQKYASKIDLSKTAGTIIELLAVAASVLSIRYSSLLAQNLAGIAGQAGLEWFYHSASSFVLAMLIFVMALEKGLISGVLSMRPVVILGEISFSIYMVHQIVLRFYGKYLPASSFLPGWAAYATYWIFILSSSYLLWRFFERPCRRFLVGLWPAQRAIAQEIVK